MFGYPVGIGTVVLFIVPWGIVPQLIILGMVILFLWLYRKKSQERPPTMEQIGGRSSRGDRLGSAGQMNAVDGVHSHDATVDDRGRREERGGVVRRGNSPDIVGGIDVSGTKFTVRTGPKWKDARLRPYRGRYIYGDDDEIRGRIMHTKPRGHYLIQDPAKQTCFKLKLVEGRLRISRKARRYELINVESEQQLGTFQQHEPRSPHWTYQIPDLDEYAVVSNTVLPWGESTTIDRPNGPTICQINTPLFRMSTTLSMEPLHPRLKVLILSTAKEIGTSRPV